MVEKKASRDFSRLILYSIPRIQTNSSMPAKVIATETTHELTYNYITEDRQRPILRESLDLVSTKLNFFIISARL